MSRAASFREKYRHTIEKLNLDLIRRFGMSLDEMAKKLEPKDNQMRDEPVFKWYHQDDEP